MGGGASSPAGNLAPLSTKAFGQKNEAAIMPETNKDADGARIDNLEAPNPNAHARSKPTRQRIFDKVSAEDLGGDVEKSNSNVIDDETRELLTFAFSGFYFLQSNSTDKNQKLDVVIRSMEREEIDENVRLITEGESGDRLYVVDSGELEVTINGEVIRTLRRSNIVGELSLLYDAPRTATVRSITKVVVWSLKRDVFKRIQAMSASAAYNERARWLINCPELAVLSAIDLSRLVGTLKMQQFDEGDYIYKEGDLTDTCVLIEKGVAEFLSTKEPKERNNLDSELGITRPRRMTSAGIYEPPPTTTMVSSFDNSSDGYHLCNVNEGCLLGIGILRSKAGMEDPWVWTKLEGELEDEDDLREGAISPYSVIAKCDMQCLTFEVNVFENLFGPVGKVLQPKKGDRKNSRCNGNIHLNREIKFDSWKFRVKHILGAGTFGVVTLAEYRADNDSPPLIVACKSLSKQAVIETGQLRHVLDERRLLALMDSRFVIKLYGAYQTPHQLVMVTEPLDGGDLWSVIYEVPQFVEINGLPPKLVRFYATSIALALSHIHEQGIAYRDLKPENVMLDIKGHLRIIDFGFAKRVPFIKIDHITREEKVCHKTYTLCGTPGRNAF
jgi:cGMP-dependent protein kinase